MNTTSSFASKSAPFPMAGPQNTAISTPAPTAPPPSSRLSSKTASPSSIPTTPAAISSPSKKSRADQPPSSSSMPTTTSASSPARMIWNGASAPSISTTETATSGNKPNKPFPPRTPQPGKQQPSPTGNIHTGTGKTFSHRMKTPRSDLAYTPMK